MSSFSSIPILDLSVARNPETKPAFLEELRYVLLEVGFLYLKNVGIPHELVQEVIKEGVAFFDLPMQEKLAIEMKNAPSFLGYSRLAAEITAHATDHREQIDLSTDHPIRTSDQPLYRNLFAPTQWPSAAHLPHFRSVFSKYITLMGEMSIFFTSLIAESIGLSADAFEKYFEEHQQHKLKIVKYPDVGELGLGEPGQGVGPHKDSMLSSYLLQVGEQKGLQVQNANGEWIDCVPIEGTLVVAVGQGMEALTKGVCKSTTHRVLSPEKGKGPRFSVPFFQGVSLDAEFEAMEVPQEVLKLRKERRDDVEFTFKKGKYKCLGEATLMNRIKSHPDVGERWYPELLREIREEQAREQRNKAQAQGKGEADAKGMNVQAKAVEAH